MKLLRAVLFTFFLVALSISGAVYAQTSSGKVISIVGNVFVESAQEAERKPLQRGNKVIVGDKIYTEKESKVKVLFEDGSLITMGQLAELKVTTLIFNKKKKRRETLMDLVKGKLRVLVPKLKGVLESKVQVKAPNAIAGVRGTYFIVSVVGDNTAGFSTSVFNLEGEVDVTDNSGQQAPLPVRQYLTVVKSLNDVKPSVITPEAMQEVDEDTKIEEKPQELSENSEKDSKDSIVKALPEFIDSDEILPQDQSDRANADLERNFFNEDNVTAVEPPPIDQQVDSDEVGKSSVNISIDGLSQ